VVHCDHASISHRYGDMAHYESSCAQTVRMSNRLISTNVHLGGDNNNKTHTHLHRSSSHSGHSCSRCTGSICHGSVWKYHPSLALGYTHICHTRIGPSPDLRTADCRLS